MTGSYESPTLELSLPDLNDTYTPAPYEPPATIGERTAKIWGLVTATPSRSALLTVAATASVIGAIVLRPVTVTTSDAHGPLIAHCGIAYYVFGHPNPVVRQSCMAAYAGHATVLYVATSVLLIALAALAITCNLRPTGSAGRVQRVATEIVGTPARGAIVALTGSAVIVALASLRTAPLHLADRVGPLTAHCGLGYYLFGNPNPIVQAGCHRAFGGHATVLLISLIVAVLGALALGGTFLTSRAGRAYAKEEVALEPPSDIRPDSSYRESETARDDAPRAEQL